MKKYTDYILIGTAVFAGCDIATGKTHESNAKPNVILFLVDDLGWSDLGCYGSRFYETPNIDKLAEDGVKFTQAYAACHVSSPSRASILTGRYPAALGLTDWLPGRGNHKFQKLETVRTEQHLPLNESTIAEELKQNGYKTAIIGKWHVGDGEYGPLSRGFDVHIPSQWLVGWPKRYYYPFNMNGYDGNPGEYLTDRMTNEAINYLENNSEAPFFLFLSHFAVHDPLEGRKDLVEKYRQKLAQMPKDSIEPYILEGNPDEVKPLGRQELDSLLHSDSHSAYKVFPDRTVKIKQIQDNIQFAAMVEAMDESLGRIVAKLEELGIDDNTILIFASDNGGMSAANFCNPRHIVDSDNLDKEYSTSNLPLRGGKGWMYEGGIRVPLIVKVPGKDKGGEICKTPVITNDLFPTIMSMTGSEISKGKILDGENIMPLINGGKIPDRDLFWHFPHYSNHGMQSPGGAIRSGKYKLLEYYENNTVQLFDLENDISEQHDLSKEKPAIVKHLTKKLHVWKESVGAKENIKNNNYTGEFPM